MALTSWRSTEDPASGEFSLHIDTHGLPQEIITKGKIITSRIGSWNGIYFTGNPWQKRQQFLNFSFVLTEQEVSYEYGLLNSSTVTRYFLNPTGLVQRFFWSEWTQRWDLYAVAPADQCESYAICGANANCNVNNSPLCECLKGFIPKFQEKWSSDNWSDGCIRRINLGCDNGDGFMNYSGMKLPDTSSSRFNKSINLEECKKLCFKNCSCSAYADLDVRNGGSGCLLWFGDIVDMRKHATAGQDIYIRVAASELGSSISIVGITILGFVLCIWRNKLENPGILKLIYGKYKKEMQDINLPAFDFSIIANATDQFSASNKLGEGGFGPIYKAWELWNEGRSFELLYVSESDSLIADELLRCIQIGLLCVQQRPEDRPDMSSVVLMLNGERPLPKPREPPSIHTNLVLQAIVHCIQ